MRSYTFRELLDPDPGDSPQRPDPPERTFAQQLNPKTVRKRPDESDEEFGRRLWDGPTLRMFR